MGPVIPVITAVAGIAGTLVSAVGTIAAGNAQQEAANYQSAQLKIKAKEERAAGQREQQQMVKQRRLALSKLTAESAGSGFSATDPSSLDLTGEIARYGTYREKMAQYGAESRYQGLKSQAIAARQSGQAAATGARFDALGTILGGVSNTMARYYDQTDYG